VSKVVGERSSFNNVCTYAANCLNEIWILISYYVFSEPTSYLSYFQAVRESIMENMAFCRVNHLRNARQPTKRRTVKNAVSITFKNLPLIAVLVTNVAAIGTLRRCL
jgi:hypothetical protein